MKVPSRYTVLSVLCFVLLSLIAIPSQVNAAPNAGEVALKTTPNGVEYGIWGEPASTPAPTLFILAGTIDGTLGDAYFRQAGTALGDHGYLCVSVDLPCHGKQHRQNEPSGLAGWRHRCEQGVDFVSETNKRLAQVLDHLIAGRHTDAGKVAACGTSRGGFLALHFAAYDPRVNCVAAYAPVTELVALREFRGAEENALVRSLALHQQAEALAGRAAWIIIGDRDERVGTDHAITLSRRITKAALAQGRNSRVDLHVVAEPRGHTTPAGAAARSADWIRMQLEDNAVSTPTAGGVGSWSPFPTGGARTLARHLGLRRDRPGDRTFGLRNGTAHPRADSHRAGRAARTCDAGKPARPSTTSSPTISLNRDSIGL